MHACLHVRMYVCMYVCMYVTIYVCIFVCVCVRAVYVAFVSVSVSVSFPFSVLHVQTHNTQIHIAVPLVLAAPGSVMMKPPHKGDMKFVFFLRVACIVCHRWQFMAWHFPFCCDRHNPNRSLD